MSSDGAAFGIDAERALRTILGGEPAPTEGEQEDRETVRARVAAAFVRFRDGAAPDGYGDCCDMVAGALVHFFEAMPEALEWPSENTYQWRVPGGEWVDHVRDLPQDTDFDFGSVESRAVGPDLYATFKTEYPRVEDLGITGFQWGWATNCARWLFEVPPQPNPAIMVLSTGAEPE